MPLSEGRRKPLTYSSYLKIDELLDLQQPLSDGPEHDETLFIIIHQVYELWFKEILHELRKLRGDLEGGDTIAALAGFKRILTILKTLVAQVDILETMTPVSFNSFRERLESASGFQSVQFREVEFILGHKNAKMVRHHAAEGAGGERLQRLLEEPTLYDSFLRFLAGNGYAVPRHLLERDLREPTEGSPEVRQLLLEIYRRDPLLQLVCERMVDLDEGIQEWRYRHVKMVERTIGAKPGTGGSAGAAYLKTTLFQPLFPDLWAIRTEL
ncbi:MAG: tryptophan 2,3-dioxygenase family protein [Thermoanaerobaculia bacterium]